RLDRTARLLRERGRRGQRSQLRGPREGAREGDCMTRAMILAAGLGTRLGGLSGERPKTLLPVCDIPLIRYSVALLAGHGVRDITVNLHHRGQQIADELRDGSRAGVKMSYSREERILGTGGGIRQALDLLDGEGPFFVINGKIVFDVDL